MVEPWDDYVVMIVVSTIWLYTFTLVLTVFVLTASTNSHTLRQTASHLRASFSVADGSLLPLPILRLKWRIIDLPARLKALSEVSNSLDLSLFSVPNWNTFSLKTETKEDASNSITWLFTTPAMASGYLLEGFNPSSKSYWYPYEHRYFQDCFVVYLGFAPLFLSSHGLPLSSVLLGSIPLWLYLEAFLVELPLCEMSLWFGQWTGKPTTRFALLLFQDCGFHFFSHRVGSSSRFCGCLWYIIYSWRVMPHSPISPFCAKIESQQVEHAPVEPCTVRHGSVKNLKWRGHWELPVQPPCSLCLWNNILQKADFARSGDRL